MSNSPSVIWSPQPKQVQALERTEFEVLYGGSRGGGKTSAGINWLLYDADNPKLRALIIRRNSDDLKDWTDRANQIYSKLGAVMTGNPPEFNWPSGAVFRTGHLKDENAYTKYQGHEYHRMLIEELDQIPSEKNYLRLRSSCRSTVPGLKPQVFLTTNPGGKGHQWIKKRFIDVVEWGKPFTTTEEINGKLVSISRVFIHATMDDNPILMENDPAYVMSIEELKDTDPELYKAWRFGDWDVFAGQVFKEFNRQKHVMRPVVPKRDFNHYLWMDWGYSENSAFAGYLSTTIKQKTQAGDPFNRVITYKEWWGNQKTPDVWATEIYRDCVKMGVKPQAGYTDPAMHNPQTDGSASIASVMEAKWKELNGGNTWVTLEKGNNTRTGRVGGVALMHNWLSLAPDGLPYWIMTENCLKLIETLPMLVYDEHDVEDVDTDQVDHGYDGCRYGLSNVKFISVKAGPLTFGAKKTVVMLPYNKEGQPTSLDPSVFASTNEITNADWGWSH